MQHSQQQPLLPLVRSRSAEEPLQQDRFPNASAMASSAFFSPPDLTEEDEEEDSHSQLDEELDAMEEVASYLARNDPPATAAVVVEPTPEDALRDNSSEEFEVEEEESQLRAIDATEDPEDEDIDVEQETELEPATSAPAPVEDPAPEVSPAATSHISASDIPASPAVAPVSHFGSGRKSAAASHRTRALLPSTTVTAATALAAARSLRGKSPRACTNPACLERLKRERAESWKMLNQKLGHDNESVAREVAAQNARAAREIAAKDARIQSLEKTQRMLLSSAAPGTAAKALLAQNEELQVTVARLRAQVEALGGVPYSAPVVTSQPVASSDAASQNDEPDQSSQPFITLSSTTSRHHSHPGVGNLYDTGSPSPMQPSGGTSLEPFFNTSAPRTVFSKADSRRRSHSFGLGREAASRSNAATTTVAASTVNTSSKAPVSPVSDPRSLRSQGTDRGSGGVLAPLPAPSAPTRPSPGTAARARANSLRSTAENVAAGNSQQRVHSPSRAPAIRQPTGHASKRAGIATTAASGAPAGNAPALPTLFNGSSVLSVNGTAVDQAVQPSPPPRRLTQLSRPSPVHTHTAANAHSLSHMQLQPMTPLTPMMTDAATGAEGTGDEEYSPRSPSGPGSSNGSETRNRALLIDRDDRPVLSTEVSEISPASSDDGSSESPPVARGRRLNGAAGTVNVLHQEEFSYEG
jgi:hypothetical protein